MKLKCCLCKREINNVVENTSLQDLNLFCESCTSRFYKAVALKEDSYRFTPEKGGTTVHHKAKNVMSQASSDKPDGEMEKYIDTDDESTVKTQDLKKDYEKKNAKLMTPKGSPFNSLGS